MGENTAIEWADHTFNPWSGYATLEDLEGWRPCWLEEDGYEGRVKALAGRRKRWKLEHVLALRGSEVLSDEDWQWLVHAYLDHMGYQRELRLAACYYAGRALRRERKAADPRSWEAVRVARRHANGKATDEELAAARDAARAAGAARAAAWAAAWAASDAAWAAGAAARAARDAAWAAARAAAWAAARAAAWDAELKAQCDWLQRTLRGAK